MGNREAMSHGDKLPVKSNGSSKHYQAVGIIRNKIRGPADTVLNFKAIITNLVFNFVDKTPVHLIQQQIYLTFAILLFKMNFTFVIV